MKKWHFSHCLNFTAQNSHAQFKHQKIKKNSFFFPLKYKNSKNTKMGISDKARQKLIKVLGFRHMICMDKRKRKLTQKEKGKMYKMMEDTEEAPFIPNYMTEADIPIYSEEVFKLFENPHAWFQDMAVAMKANESNCSGKPAMNHLTNINLKTLARHIYEYGGDGDKDNSIKHRMRKAKVYVASFDHKPDVPFFKEKTQGERIDSINKTRAKEGLGPVEPYPAGSTLTSLNVGGGLIALPDGKSTTINLGRLLISNGHNGCSKIVFDFWKILPEMLNQCIRDDIFMPDGRVLFVNIDSTGPYQIEKGVRQMKHRPDLKHVLGEGELDSAWWSARLTNAKGMRQLFPDREDMIPLDLHLCTTDSDIVAINLLNKVGFTTDVYWHSKQVPYDEDAKQAKKQAAAEKARQKRKALKGDDDDEGDGERSNKRRKTESGFTEVKGRTTEAGFACPPLKEGEPDPWKFRFFALHLNGLKEEGHKFAFDNDWESFAVFMQYILDEGTDYWDRKAIFHGQPSVKVMEAYQKYRSNDVKYNTIEDKFIAFFFSIYCDFFNIDKSRYTKGKPIKYKHLEKIRVLTKTKIIPSEAEIKFLAHRREFQYRYWRNGSDGSHWLKSAQHIFKLTRGEPIDIADLKKQHRCMENEATLLRDKRLEKPAPKEKWIGEVSEIDE